MERFDRIAVVRRLNRPERLNAINDVMASALREACTHRWGSS
jgi:enoyl-CoA hydratase/carnithine racemase